MTTMMKCHWLALPIVLASANAWCAGETPAAVSDRYDGEWMVTVACADTHDRHGLVKGYDLTFRVTIADGKLRGQYGEKGAPASVVYTGEVGADGTLALRAAGNTGNAENTVGSVARGTPYAYTMEGKLDASHGEAVRRELRPCKATFSRRE